MHLAGEDRVGGVSGGGRTFGEVDFSDGVALSEPDGHHADQVGVHFLLRVLLPAHHQRRVPTGRHQVLVKELVVGHWNTARTPW